MNSSILARYRNVRRTGEELAHRRAWRTYNDLYQLEGILLVIGIYTFFATLWGAAIILSAVLMFVIHFGTALRTANKMTREEMIADIGLRNEIARESERFM